MAEAPLLASLFKLADVFPSLLLHTLSSAPQAPHGMWKGMMAFPPPLQATYIIPPTPFFSLPKPWPPTHTTSTNSHSLQSEPVAPAFKPDTSPSLEDLILPYPHPASGSRRPSAHLTSFLLMSHHHPTDEGPCACGQHRYRAGEALLLFWGLVLEIPPGGASC